MNVVMQIGRLTADPELDFVKDGEMARVKFKIAVDRIGAKTGEVKADFFQVKVFGKKAEAIANNVKKGDLISVRGELRNFDYEKEGQKFYGTEILASETQFLTPKSK